MLKITYLVILILLFNVLSQTQGFAQELNRLLIELKQAKEDTNQIKLLNAIASQELLTANLNNALNYSEKAYKLAEKLNYPIGEAQAGVILGKIYRKKKNYTTSLNYYLEANTTYQSLKDFRNLSSTQSEIALLYQEQGAYDKSIEYFNLANQNAPLNESENLKIANLQGVGLCYLQLKNYEKASETYEKILEYYKAQNNPKAMIRTLDKLGEISSLAQNYEKSLNYYNEIIKVNQRANDAISLAASLNNIGYLYKQNGDNQKSLKSFRQALELNKQLYSSSTLQALKDRNATMAINIGVTYSNLQNYREARKFYGEALKIYEAQQNNYGIGKTYNYFAATYYVAGNNEQAANNALKAIEYGKKIPANDILITAYKILSDVYQKNGDFREAQAYYKLYLDLKEDQTEKNRKKEQEMLQNQIDIERKESELKSIQAEKEKQTLSLNQLKLEKEKQEADIALKAKELEVLRSNQERQAVELKNQQLEKDRVQQLLQLTQQRAEADKQKAQADKQKQEILVLEQDKKIKDLALKQKIAQDKEKQKEIELRDRKLKDGELIQNYGIGLLALLGVILVLILFGFAQSRKARKALSKQNAEINEQKSMLENFNAKLTANEQILQKSNDKLMQSERQIREKNEELQASEEELRQNMEELEANKEEIETQKEALQTAYKAIEEKNLVFTHSIKYAEKIQQAILPTEFEFKQRFNDFFVLFQPKDVVSGDFYWLTYQDHKTFVACVDCTGHGVPGAFMSLIGNALLNEIVNEKKIHEPHKILETLHIEVQKALRQRETNGIEGMDMVICILEKWEDDIYSLQFSGAKNSAYYFHKGEFHELLGDRKAIGGYQSETYREFTHQVVRLDKGDTIYLTTDGFTDTPNPKRKKFGDKRLKEILKQEKEKPLKEQHEILLKALHDHHDGAMQRDDITFLGLKL